MLKGNVFDKKNSLFLKPKKSIPLSFEKALNSIDNSKLYFTNYLSSKNCNAYREIKRFYIDSSNNNIEFLLKEFTNSEFTTANLIKNNRIRELIKLTTGKLLNDFDLQNLVKYKNKKDMGIQLFVMYDKETGSGIVYLIDLYHFALPTPHVQIGKTSINLEQEYNIRKNRVKHKMNLSEIRKIC